MPSEHVGTALTGPKYDIKEYNIVNIKETMHEHRKCKIKKTKEKVRM